ncbi:MAG: exonuclease [Candidatus Nitrosoabyssus spongiisocia]|nr:MAG: exonuclease [Nitrosopumilaceae archaeon AB1(1)]
MVEFRTTPNGIVCKYDDTIVHLDPKNSSEEGINFVSHAHLDHLPRGDTGIFLSSVETRRLALSRKYKMSDHRDYYTNFQLINNGHILGSRGLLFNDIYYTGDICTRTRGVLQAATIPKCKTLIIETTFGKPKFVFPPISKIKNDVNKIISKAYSNGQPVVLLGYKLGKAQILSEMFSNWDPLYYHDSIKLINDVYIELGVNLKSSCGHLAAERNNLLGKKPWVMIAPKDTGASSFVKVVKSRYDAIVIDFTGWAVSTPFGISNYKIPLSDHCDFNELIHVVKASEATKVYTVHGYTSEFSSTLQDMGIDSSPLVYRKSQV